MFSNRYSWNQTITDGSMLLWASYRLPTAISWCAWAYRFLKGTFKDYSIPFSGILSFWLSFLVFVFNAACLFLFLSSLTLERPLMKPELACSGPSFLPKFEALRFWVLWSTSSQSSCCKEDMGDVVLSRPPASNEHTKWCIWMLHSNPDFRLIVGCWCCILRTEPVLTGQASDKVVCTEDSMELHVENQRHWCVLWIFMQSIMKIARSVSWDELESSPWDIKPFLS